MGGGKLVLVEALAAGGLLPVKPGRTMMRYHLPEMPSTGLETGGSGEAD